MQEARGHIRNPVPRVDATRGCRGGRSEPRPGALNQLHDDGLGPVHDCAHNGGGLQPGGPRRSLSPADSQRGWGGGASHEDPVVHSPSQTYSSWADHSFNMAVLKLYVSVQFI